VIREQLVGAAFSEGVGLLEEAARRQLNQREALAWLCAAEVSSKEQRRLSMALTIARFPFVRTLEGFEFEAQPSIDPGTSRLVANGDNVVLLCPPGVGKTRLEVALGHESPDRGGSRPAGQAAAAQGGGAGGVSGGCQRLDGAQPHAERQGGRVAPAHGGLREPR
jgi:hypothetical protein